MDDVPYMAEDVSMNSSDNIIGYSRNTVTIGAKCHYRTTTLDTNSTNWSIIPPHMGTHMRNHHQTPSVTTSEQCEHVRIVTNTTISGVCGNRHTACNRYESQT